MEGIVCGQKQLMSVKQATLCLEIQDLPVLQVGAGNLVICQNVGECRPLLPTKITVSRTKHDTKKTWKDELIWNKLNIEGKV